MAYTDSRIDSFAQAEFRIGRVLSKSISVFFQNIVTFTLISAVVSLPFIIISTLQEGSTQEDQAIRALVGFGVLLFLSPLATAVILHATFQHMRGRPVRLGESVSQALGRFLPLLGVMVLQTLGISLGFLLLIIPGFILLTMWYAAVPVCIAERAGPIRSLGRSRELTKGYRWRIVGLMFLLGIMGGIGSAVFVLLGTALAQEWGAIAAQTLWQGLSGGFGSVAVAVAYYYLRVAKEGVDVDQIAAVFD